MGYDLGDIEYETGGGFGPYEATITNAGAGISDYGPEIVLVCEPTNPNRRIQILHMSIGKGEFEFSSDAEVITTGTGEKAFDVTIHKEIISGPKINILTKSGLFLNALKHLGFEERGGNMRAYIGMKLDLEEIKYNDAIKRFNDMHPKTALPILGKENTKITIPLKIIGMRKTLEEEVMEYMDSEKTEDEMMKWAGREGHSMKEVFTILDEKKEKGELVFDGKTYMTVESKKEAESGATSK